MPNLAPDRHLLIIHEKSEGRLKCVEVRRYRYRWQAQVMRLWFILRLRATPNSTIKILVSSLEP